MSEEEYESDNSEINYSKKRKMFSSTDEEKETFTMWHEPIAKQPNLMSFTSPSGFIIENLNISSNVAIETCYEQFVPDTLFEEIAEQTNLYASQQLQNKSSQRLCKWTLTNKNEIKKFFGLILWMGLVRLPSLHLYWSHDPAYIQTFPKKVMSRNRFELLLRMLHFADNKKNDGSSRLYEIQPLIDTLGITFKKYFNPTEDICINEALIPFNNYIIFGQYLKKEHNICGINIFKLCCEPGYTYAFLVYIGKIIKKNNTMPPEIVMSLCKDLFDKGHTLYTNDLYTSVELAERLIDKNIHLVGTLNSNQWNLPQQVISKKLKPWESIANENEKGITVLKWKDKRDILLLSTKHSSQLVNVKRRLEQKLKPQIVVDYNRGKAAADLSDLMRAYYPLRRSLKWYKKLAFEFLLNIAVMNSIILYKNITKKNITINEFRKQLALYLTGSSNGDIPSSSIATTIKQIRHKLEKKPGKVSKMRKYCKLCYEESAAKYGREIARKTTKQVATFCNTCEGQPFLCLPCFNKMH
ncbi:PREDICTED: piggyBac transposable element-derived protein 4-like [Polistes dominula]|uniref:PiggyBac transposable element-derived protein 4-like n=1 Tax=Polistes dominula TaxID=743375 RepID=A0ABM1IBC9_POLDO|nr:PREDICTED: piggyBac transposable element-derived protein 4-like [Polistes dominula]